MINSIISERLNIGLRQINSCVELLNDGATIPFISRYRKEATGSLDEVQVTNIKEQFDKLTALVARKESVVSTIEEQGKMTSELKKRIDECWDSTQLEDIYLPYKPKRRTRATIAKENGLEPLANIIMAQNNGDIAHSAKRFINKNITTTDEAIDGACDIIAERMSENEYCRESVRTIFLKKGLLHAKVVKGKETEIKYKDYFDTNDPLRRVSSHRFLAIERGVEGGVLKVGVEVEKEDIESRLERSFIKNSSETRDIMQKAIKESVKRLIYPSIENQILSQAKERADEEAIAVFAENLRQLLLSSPLGEKRVLALDPGFRTGCKVVVLSSEGELLENCTIYPHPPQNQRDEATAKIASLVKRYSVEAIAIGDGTAGRESEAFVKSIPFSEKIDIFSVSEDGASVYSASEVARREFPNHDVTVRGAVSIGRRLMDPLSELVKIEPKSIGVGQYQHSVDQSKLKAKLSVVVESCVNKVGVNLNTASKEILTYISGLGESLAQNIVTYRAENGAFRERKELLKVKRLGAKAYEQAAGFLRITNGVNPLDNSAVHPESYYIVAKMAKDMGVSIEELLSNGTIRKNLVPSKYVDEKVGLPTITDIIEAMDKRGLDPRSALTSFSFDDTIRTIDDLRVGMRVPAIVTNITAFGAFADVGIKQDGLIHISQMSDRFISSPNECVHIGDRLMVRVIEIDNVRGRVSLSLKDA